MAQERSRSAARQAPRVRRPRSRREREELRQKIVLGLIGLAILVAVLVIVVPFVNRQVLEPRRALAHVGDVTITRADYDAQYKFNSLYLYDPSLLKNVFSAYEQNPNGVRSQLQQQIQQLPQAGSPDPQVLDAMVDNAVLVQSAPDANIRVTDQRVRQLLLRDLGGSSQPAASPTTTPTATPKAGPTPTPAPASPQQVDRFFDMLSSTAGISEDEYMKLVVAPQYVRERYTDEHVPKSGPQVHVRHIVVPTKKEAEEVLRKLRSGVKFEVLAKQYSTDTSNKDKGGDLGWAPKGVFVKPFERAAFSLTRPGQIAGPIHTRFGWHIIQLLERSSNRKLTDAQRQQVGAQLVQKFIDEHRAQLKRQGRLEVNLPPTPTPVPTAAPQG